MNKKEGNRFLPALLILAEISKYWSKHEHVESTSRHSRASSVVKIDTELSNPFSCNTGIRQGRNLSLYC